MRRIALFSIILLVFLACSDHASRVSKLTAEVLISEFIYESAPFPECHASTIVETSSGITAAWFGGTYERHPDVSVYLSTRNEDQWSTPRLVADGFENDTLRYPCWNPVLVNRDNGDLILFYKVGPSPREWWGSYKILKKGDNEWSAEHQLPEQILGPIKNKPVRLTDGTLLHPTSLETEEKWSVYMETCNQELTEWNQIEIDNLDFNAIQPTILVHNRNTLQILCRSREKLIVESWSFDMGKSWTPLAATSLVNNNSGIDAVTTSKGWHLLVCNPQENGRNKLSLLVSADGKEWKELLILEDQPEGEFSYPAIIEDKEQLIHITYTYNRRKIKYMKLSVD